MNGGDGLVGAALDGERQAVAGGGDGVEHAGQEHRRASRR
jgi:hypothetical protein